MKPSLQLKLSQHLALTPQLQQSIKLLQLSTIELNQEIEKVLLENPMLERDEPESQLGSSRVEAPGPLAPAGSEAAQEREREHHLARPAIGHEHAPAGDDAEHERQQGAAAIGGPAAGEGAGDGDDNGKGENVGVLKDAGPSKKGVFHFHIADRAPGLEEAEALVERSVNK